MTVNGVSGERPWNKLRASPTSGADRIRRDEFQCVGLSGGRISEWLRFAWRVSVDGVGTAMDDDESSCWGIGEKKARSPKDMVSHMRPAKRGVPRFRP